MINCHKKNSSGVALLEVLIALLILALGVIGVTALQLRTMKLTTDSTQRSVAMAKAQDLADRMRNNRNAISAYVDNFDTTFCSAGQPSPACLNVAPESACTTTQIAAYDLWEVFCQVGGVDDGLPSWSTHVSCSDSSACANANATATIVTSWATRGFDGVSSSATPAATGSPAPAALGVGDQLTLSFVP